MPITAQAQPGTSFELDSDDVVVGGGAMILRVVVCCSVVVVRTVVVGDDAVSVVVVSSVDVSVVVVSAARPRAATALARSTPAAKRAASAAAFPYAHSARTPTSRADGVSPAGSDVDRLRLAGLGVGAPHRIGAPVDLHVQLGAGVLLERAVERDVHLDRRRVGGRRIDDDPVLGRECRPRVDRTLAQNTSSGMP